jgi:hypothetical protein
MFNKNKSLLFICLLINMHVQAFKVIANIDNIQGVIKVEAFFLKEKKEEIGRLDNSQKYFFYKPEDKIDYLIISFPKKRITLSDLKLTEQQAATTIIKISQHKINKEFSVQIEKGELIKPEKKEKAEKAKPAEVIPTYHEINLPEEAEEVIPGDLKICQDELVACKAKIKKLEGELIEARIEIRLLKLKIE